MTTKICRRSDCSLGGLPQPIEVFAIDKTRPDGRHPYCRSCRTALAANRLAKSADAREKTREAQARYRASETGRERIRAHYTSREYRERVNEYARDYAKRPEVREKLAEKRKAYDERNQLKVCARRAVVRALRTGVLTKPPKCEWCGLVAGSSALEGHHWKGYEPEEWLSVKFVHADPCHLQAHQLPPGEWR